MKRYIIFPIFMALFGCANERQNEAQNTCDGGRDLAHAIILPGPKTETEGVTAEHAFVKSCYPGWYFSDQYLLTENGRTYDQIHLTKDNQKKVIYFDISTWFGHW